MQGMPIVSEGILILSNFLKGRKQIQTFFNK